MTYAVRVARDEQSFPPSEAPDFDESCRFVDALVQIWQLHGVTSRAMVQTLAKVSAALGLKAEFVATPSYVQTVFRSQDDSKQRVMLSVASGSNYNMAKLAQVMAVAERVETRAMQPVQGLAHLREIMLAKEAFGPMVNALAFIFCAGGFAIIIGASWLDAAVGALLSLGSYAIVQLARRSAGIAALQELIAAALAAGLAAVAATYLPAINAIAVASTAIVWFVPGFGLTLAPSELMAGSTLSGLLWFTNAIVAVLKLLGGAGIGMAIAGFAGFVAPDAPALPPIDPGWSWIAVPCLILSMAILFKADRRTFLGVAAGGWLAWAALQLGSAIGPWQGTFLGSMVLVIYANWYGRKLKVPTVAILLPCVMVLLPGYAALQAAHTASTAGLLAGLKAAYSVGVLISAIIGGVLVGDALAVHKLIHTGASMANLINRRLAP